MERSNVLSRQLRAVLQDVDLPFLKLRTEKILPPGEHLVEIRIGLKSYQANVTPVRSSEACQWVRLLDGGRSGEFLEHRFLQDRTQTKAEDRRDGYRHAATLLVESPDLPSGRGTTYDISRFGIRLVTESPVTVGKVLRLSVRENLRPQETPATRVCGKAVWCAAESKSQHHVGVRLLEAEPSTNS